MRPLRISAVALASLSAAGCSASADGAPEVVVVGAGISGLAASRALSDGGAHVQVLEARNRMGGRIHTDRDTFGIPVELGANWIEGDSKKNPITGLAAEFGVSSILSNYHSVEVHDREGALVPPDQYWPMSEKWKQTYHELITHRPPLDHDDSVADEIAKLDPTQGLSEEDAVLFDMAAWWDFESSYAVTFADASAHAFEQDDAFGGYYRLMTSGEDAIVEGLAKDLDVHLSEPVTAVTQTASGVVVTTADGEYAADYAVVSVSLGALQSGAITFSPPPPSDWQAAVSHLGMAVADKVFVHFPRKFWPDRDFLLLGDPRGDVYTIEVTVLTKYQDQPLLLVWPIADYARELEAMSDADAEAEMVRRFRVAFGSAVPDADGFLMSRHAEDPLEHGAYSYVPVGGSLADSDVIKGPVGRIYFAGEHTSSRYPGELFGAYFSGTDAAAAILAKDGPPMN